MAAAMGAAVRRLHAAQPPRLTKLAVEVEFADGSSFRLPAEFLRVYSPAADSKIRSVAGEKVILENLRLGVHASLETRGPSSPSREVHCCKPARLDSTQSHLTRTLVTRVLPVPSPSPPAPPPLQPVAGATLPVRGGIASHRAAGAGISALPVILRSGRDLPALLIQVRHSWLCLPGCLAGTAAWGFSVYCEKSRAQAE
ncbi:hypothetical protein E2562_032047 [Oryza meyeriana var. granulata]|uniref:Gamma-butyrobetaine hydroxylase-like N-terminal domain-containing protein n=1 Tax=Oryza meyeriana var. granulata TaxID=110450 RepID=A0A6G1FEY0_9ORYZ|nr:hypothetical protein E2562_032047 [Oryza meyeriana var. granulata]KAF0935353.1 hypothetical protein E2562_032047 [Oryza meyeriana var. granulata]KAF0935354.1 hypothetical protein E2562_032047 [Oryza meyeriana var. granulata]KAF0935355.1 hypothetical protein E2562_032047 [Oryza meyeriana var. granulata]KAF0935356.1 hypothetical protein E2562_032047 [Oryza meyeriana var. granulata]